MTDSQKKNAGSFPNASPKSDQDGAARDQMAEYTILAKKYNAMSKDNYIIKSDEVKRLKYIYGLMSDKQKKNAEPFPNFPASPPPPPPNEKELKDAQIAAKVMYVKARKANQKAKLAHSKEAKKNYDAQIAAKAKYVVAREDMGKAKLARVAEVKENKDVAKAAKIKYVKEKDAIKMAKTAQEAELKFTREALKVERIKYTKAKKALANAKKVRALEIAEVSSPQYLRISPLDHAIKMAKKDAIFYLEDKEITSDKAIKILRSKRRINISTIGADSNQPKVYLTRKPVVIEN